MNVEVSKISLLIIAGGKSSRMGRDKRWLTIDGKSFLELAVQKGLKAGFQDIIICAEKISEELRQLQEHYPVELVFDENIEMGPMEGLRQGLSAMKNDHGWALSCDMPFFEFSSCKKMLESMKNPQYAEKNIWAVAAVASGKYQPLASIYSKKILPKIEAEMKAGQCRMMRLFQENTCDVNLDDRYGFFNVNNEADYRMALGRMANSKRKNPVVTVSAPQSGTGKTTFIERLIPVLKERGIRAGVVKRDCHGFDLDVEGKDSQRFTSAGAEAVAVVSPDSYFIIQKTKKQADVMEIAQKLNDVDVVLIESRAHGVFPVLKLWRGLGELNVDENTVAVFSKEEIQSSCAEVYSLDDMERAADVVEFLIGCSSVQ